MITRLSGGMKTWIDKHYNRKPLTDFENFRKTQDGLIMDFFKHYKGDTHYNMGVAKLIFEFITKGEPNTRWNQPLSS